jgi:uncharacterized damage-inducible protein DinB
MNVDDIRTLYAFNRWATETILTAVRALSEEEYARDLGTSHRSVRGTLVHTMWAEWIWLRRWHGESPTRVFSEEEFPTVQALEARWAEIESQREGFLSALTDADLARRVAYENLRGERWEYPLVHMLQHVVNHGTYHRGQVVTLLRQLGRAAPATDLLLYVDRAGGATSRP